MQTQSAEQTIHDISLRRTALSSLLQAFSPILSKQEELSNLFADEFSKSNILLNNPETERMRQGISVLSDSQISLDATIFSRGADALLPSLSTIPLLKEKAGKIASVFSDLSSDLQRTFVEAVCANDPERIAAFASEKDVEPLETMLFANFLVQTILHALVSASYLKNKDIDEEMPWETNNIWQQGYCPVCGSYPTIAWLDRGKVDERNTYLLPGGARKHLHCGVCGANWRFLRLSCPLCGIQKSKQLEILSEENDKHGEALDVCKECNSYCPTVDIRDRIAMPNLEAQALGMLHLELIAHERGLQPLRRSFWNSFS